MDLPHGCTFKLAKDAETLNKFIGQGLVSFMQEHNYDPGTISFMKGDCSKETYDALSSNNHSKDSRDPREYGVNLVLNWILEDYTMSDILPKIMPGYISKAGADKDRKFLKYGEVKSDPDLLIRIGKELVSIEIVADFKGYWAKTRTIELRDKKYPKLIEKAKHQKVYLLCIDVSNCLFKLFPIKEWEEKARYLTFHKPWGKPAYQLDIDIDTFQPVQDLKQAA